MIGAGSWGTALARHVGSQGLHTVLWAREPEVVAGIADRGRNPLFLREVDLPATVRATTDLEEAIAYRCAVCGMQLTVTRAAGEGFKAPRHCMEEMEPTG